MEYNVNEERSVHEHGRDALRNGHVGKGSELISAEIKNDAFYFAIERLARYENVKTVLEIGSSSGDGSTEAFVKGLQKNRNECKLFCVEISKARCSELVRRYRNVSFVRCYNLSTVSGDMVLSQEDVTEFYRTFHTNLNKYPLEQVLGWLRSDIEQTSEVSVAGNGIREIQKENNIDGFDMVLIDGSAFTGRAELKQVYGSKIIMLDDINDIKNYLNYVELINDPRYYLLEEDWGLRNGYAIFKRTEEVLPVHFFTIVLNGEPFIRYHIDVLKELPFRWHWHIVEGVADLKHDTAWSLKQGGQIPNDMHRNGMSIDGTSEYIDGLKRDFPENVSVYRRSEGKFWDGKLEMINAPLESISEECLLWQIDADELWTKEQLIAGRRLFLNHPDKSAAYYYCQYFVGDKLVTTTRGTYGNNISYEWLRTWRFRPGCRWMSHEPPRLCKKLSDGTWKNIGNGRIFSHNETEEKGLVFQHYAYAMESQIRFKEAYFGYKNGVKQWKELQAVDKFPVFLKDYFKWVKDDCQVDTAEAMNIQPISKKDKEGRVVFCFPVSESKEQDARRDPFVLSVHSEDSQIDRKVTTGEARHGKKVMVVCHERSGTHFLINSIAMNFPYFLNSELSVVGTSRELQKLFESMYFREERRIIKSHHQFYFFAPFFRELVKHFHIFYVVRDGRDVLTSCFHYFNAVDKRIFPHTNSISEFLSACPCDYPFDAEYTVRKASSMGKRWSYHVESWMPVMDKITVIKYENLKLCFDKTIENIAHVLGIEKPKEPKMPSLKNDRSVAPRKGIVGDWKNYFSDSDLSVFNEASGRCMKAMNYDGDTGKSHDTYGIINWIRTDNLGDNILSASMLAHIRNKYRDAKLIVLCQEQAENLYQACPFIDSIVTFNKKRAYQDTSYRDSIISELKKHNPDLSLNSVFSREPLTDLFAIEPGAKERIAFEGNLCNIDQITRDRHNLFYSRLLTNNEEHKLEIERHKDFLKALGIQVASLDPVVWTKAEDEEFADAFFRDTNLIPEKTIALFSGVGYQVRTYDEYGVALYQGINDKGFTIIGLGSENEFEQNERNLRAVNGSVINLSGRTTLRQTAALLKRCRLAVGAETGLAHMACAVGTPNVILLGGGHFGRFMPYSPLTTVVCLPLECYGCNWHCKYKRVHCVRDILPEVLGVGIKEALARPCGIPRVVVQGASLCNSIYGTPKWIMFERHLNPKNVKIIEVEETQLGGKAKELWSKQASERSKINVAEAFCRRGRELVRIGSVEAGLREFQKGLSLCPDYAIGHQDLAEIYYKGGNDKKAFAHYRKAVELDPRNASFQKRMADFYYVVMRDSDAALEHYARALSSNPEDVDVLLMLGHISVSKKKFEEAAVFYEKVLQIDPENEDAKHYAEAIAGKNRVHIDAKREVVRSTGPQAIWSGPSGNSKRLMQGRELLWFEWVVTDFCNLNCDYCVNKGQYSGKPSGQIQYIPGREVEIARRIVALGQLAERVFVNLTGGEPTLSEHIVDIISLLSQKPNIYVQLISNLKLIDKLGERLAPYFPLINIVGSIHVSYRTHEDIERIIRFINKYRSVLNIQLTQVNNRLSRKDIEKLVHIKNETGLKIGLQAYSPPAGETSFTNNATRDANVVSSQGKRCCLGYSAFLLEPNGNLIYGLWCARRLTADFLAIDPADFGAYMYDEMKKCPKRSCDCNYNMFAYDFYLRACRRLGYPSEEVFPPNNAQGKTSPRQGAAGC